MATVPTENTRQWLGRPRPRLRRVGTRYSRFVGLMKLFMPLAAGSLIITLIVWPQFTELPRNLSLGMSSLSVETVGGQRLVNARYTGTNHSNQPYTVIADRLDQRTAKSEIIDLTNPKADLAMAGGSWIAVRAPAGRFNRTTQVLELVGVVDVFHDAGYELHTRDATMKLRQGQAYGENRVVGRGPSGKIESEGFRILNAGQRILFTGKARLRVHPARGRAAK